MTSTKHSPKDIRLADIQWSDGLPVSRQFDDIYYSKEDGLAESRHVFIDGNNLDARWAVLDDGDRFTIMEAGFGTGLNFLCAAQRWLETTTSSTTLHYISVEKFPLSKEALTHAHAT